MAKIKADLKKHWLSWIGFIGLVAIGIPLIVYLRLENTITALWDSYMYEIRILVAVAAGWTACIIALFFLRQYKMQKEKGKNEQ